MAEALKSNTTLQSFVLKGGHEENVVSSTRDDWRYAMVEALKANVSLHSFNLRTPFMQVSDVAKDPAALVVSRPVELPHIDALHVLQAAHK